MKGVSPFATLHVTSDQVRSFESQARLLLDDTLREYDAHVTACRSGKNPLLDKWKWKPLQTHEGLNVFKERQPTHPELNPLASRTSKTSGGSISGHSVTSSTERPAKPTQAVAMAAYTPGTTLSTSAAAVTGSSSIASAVVTGHIDGSLNDAMYGLLATDTAEVMLRSRYMTDAEVLDTAMISCIQTPSAVEPFQFLGLQWLVRGEASRVKASARSPRDFVLVVASGVVRHTFQGATEAQEVGYYLSQSVDMHECVELRNQGLTRGWLSTCSLFTPSKNSAQLDVFSRGFVDFRGKMQDYQAANMMATLMLAGVTEAATCGQNRKLGWLLNFKGAAAEFRQALPEPKVSSNRCGICERKFGVLHSVASCSLCQAKTCSRCRISRDVSFVNRRDTAVSVTQSRSWDEGHLTGGQVRCITAVLCKNCKMSASHLDARVMAQREVEASYGLNDLARTAPVGGVKNPVQHVRSSLSYSARSDSEHSFSDSSSSQMRFWTPSTDTAKLRGREGEKKTAVAWTPGTDTSALRGNRDDHQTDDVVKPTVMIGRMDKSKLSDSSARTKLESSVSSYASTLPSPRDRDSSQEDSSFELTTYQPRQQHQPQYISEDPEITYTYTAQSSGSVKTKADLMRRMQELQMNAESVYQFTSQMNAKTRHRHPQSSNSSTSISELD